MKTTYAYFAGLIDGEGHMALAKRSDRPSLKPFIQVNMTNEVVIRKLQETFGGQVQFIRRAKSHHKDQWRWRVFNRMARDCLTRIHPYLVVKRADADLLLAHMAIPRQRGRPPR